MITEIILLIVTLLIIDAFFAGSETALTSLNKIRLRHLVELKDKRAILINNFLAEEGKFLATTLVGTNISVIAASAMSTMLLSVWFGKHAAIISTFLITFIVLVFCEIIPKTIFRQSSNAISLKIITPLHLAYRILFPVVVVVNTVAKIILKPFKKHIELNKSQPFLTKEDIKEVLQGKNKSELADIDERMLIQRIFNLGITNASNIMIPLNRAVLLNANDSADKIKQVAKKTHYSRFPVYENKLNNVIGILNIYDILFHGADDKTAKDYTTSPYFINENDRIDKVLSSLKKKKKPMSIVINEQGQSVGLVTIEDLLEEIVGEIEG